VISTLDSVVVGICGLLLAVGFADAWRGYRTAEVALRKLRKSA